MTIALIALAVIVVSMAALFSVPVLLPWDWRLSKPGRLKS